MPHVALLGDSIFDNAPYTAGGASVIDHVRGMLPPDWAADLLAVDGSISADVPEQLKKLTAQHTHLVLSVGGNDALQRADVLEAPVKSSGEALLMLAGAADAFAAIYQPTVDKCLAFGKPVILCTIYNGNFDAPAYQAAARMALCAFNDVIVRTAIARNLRIIELRNVCTVPADFANPIEPSVQGGAKIAKAIAGALFESPATAPGARIAP